MRIRLLDTPKVKKLGEIWNLKPGELYQVKKVTRHKSHGNCKIKKEWNCYWILQKSFGSAIQRAE
jgi:hypothetical protein